MMTCPFCHSQNMQQYAAHCVVRCLDCGALFYDNAEDTAHLDTHPTHPASEKPKEPLVGRKPLAGRIQHQRRQTMM